MCKEWNAPELDQVGIYGLLISLVLSGVTLLAVVVPRWVGAEEYANMKKSIDNLCLEAEEIPRQWQTGMNRRNQNMDSLLNGRGPVNSTVADEKELFLRIKSVINRESESMHTLIEEGVVKKIEGFRLSVRNLEFQLIVRVLTLCFIILLCGIGIVVIAWRRQSINLHEQKLKQSLGLVQGASALRLDKSIEGLKSLLQETQNHGTTMGKMNEQIQALLREIDNVK